ncbi:MAG TPA: hypothetical protein VF644_07320 [Pyrinomonadaceae bacterium]|jgi:hypothetical protein
MFYFVLISGGILSSLYLIGKLHKKSFTDHPKTDDSNLLEFWEDAAKEVFKNRIGILREGCKTMVTTSLTVLAVYAALLKTFEFSFTTANIFPFRSIAFVITILFFIAANLLFGFGYLPEKSPENLTECLVVKGKLDIKKIKKEIEAEYNCCYSRLYRGTVLFWLGVIFALTSLLCPY